MTDRDLESLAPPPRLVALADRIARALPATIIGRPFATPDQQAIYKEYVRVADPATKLMGDAAHEARVAWLARAIGEAMNE